MFTTIPTSKAKVREELAQLAAEFLALGGEITVCPPTPTHRPTYWADLRREPNPGNVVDLVAWVRAKLG